MQQVKVEAVIMKTASSNHAQRNTPVKSFQNLFFSIIKLASFKMQIEKAL